MKKSFIYVAIACATTFAFTSCGGNKDAKSADETATEQPAEINSIDKAIDEYEKFADEVYIPAIKGAASGDAELMTKLQEALPRLAEISEQFNDPSKFSPAQLERLEKIAQKLAAAAGQ